MLAQVALGPDAAALFPWRDKLERLVAAFGSNSVAALLGVSKSQPSRWRAGREAPSPANRARLVDLEFVVDRLLAVLWPEQAGDWLVGANPHLGGARPVDVLALHGPAPVILAIDALSAGTFA